MFSYVSLSLAAISFLGFFSVFSELILFVYFGVMSGEAVLFFCGLFFLFTETGKSEHLYCDII